jgi:hypothetical protein
MTQEQYWLPSVKILIKLENYFAWAALETTDKTEHRTDGREVGLCAQTKSAGEQNRARQLAVFEATPSRKTRKDLVAQKTAPASSGLERLGESPQVDQQRQHL